LGTTDYGDYRSDKFSPDGSNVIEVLHPKSGQNQNNNQLNLAASSD